jgi:hypothetical protein
VTTKGQPNLRYCEKGGSRCEDSLTVSQNGCRHTTVVGKYLEQWQTAVDAAKQGRHVGDVSRLGL